MKIASLKKKVFGRVKVLNAWVLGVFSFPGSDAIPLKNNKPSTFRPLALHEPPLLKAEDILKRFQNIQNTTLYKFILCGS